MTDFLSTVALFLFNHDYLIDGILWLISTFLIAGLFSLIYKLNKIFVLYFFISNIYSFPFFLLFWFLTRASYSSNNFLNSPILLLLILLTGLFLQAFLAYRLNTRALSLKKLVFLSFVNIFFIIVLSNVLMGFLNKYIGGTSVTLPKLPL